MKRKRLEMLETSPSGADSRPKRRRNDTTLLDTIQYIFDCLRNYRKDDEDVYLCEAFLRVPRKKTEPQYFDVVKRPIDMLKIQQKIKTDQYDELQDFCDDVQLLVDNAKLYYAKSTEEYKDACQLWILFEESRIKAPDEVKEKQKQKQQQMEEDEKFTSKKRGISRTCRGASAPLILMEDGLGMTQREAIQELFGAIVTARDGDDRLLSYVFRILPSKERYPEYYTVIDKPIDLRTMATRICDDEYDDLESIVQDFDLMFSNACQFNEPGSCIFRDACKLKKFVHLRKQDLQDVIAAGRGRLRCRKPAEGGEWHVLLSGLEEGAALPLAEEEISASDEAATLGTAADDDDNDDDADPENPLWKLFLLAKNLTVPSNQNYHLIEPFRRLPNRRWHADYYNEIIHPISMSQIRNKIKKGEYTSITDLHADFNLMLNNAQHYNRPDSRIHRDAITLQAAVNAAVVQITGEGKVSGRAAAATAATHAAGQTGWADSDTDGEDSRQSMSSSNRRRAGQAGSELSFKRRARLLFKTLMDYMTEDGRQPIVAFIEKPSRREYPDYYQVIEKPIDMETIETRIKSDFYGSEKELLADFRLMFNNCITYNEEGSVIHSDAQTLDKVLTDKVSELNQGGSSSCGLEAAGAGDVSYDTPGSSSLPLPTPVLSHHGSSASATPTSHIPGVAQTSKVLQLKKAKQQPPLGTLRNVKNVYNAVREYRDGDGRQISDVFLKLPSKILYPDYYELIKHPIDLERVLYKWKTGTYSSVDDCLADLTLLFNNACRYNEPDSQIYRDALTLQQIALQKRLELVWQDAKVPRVRALVQELLMSLFITVFNHEDKGRYTAESFADIPTQDPAPRSEHQTGSLTSKNRPLTFDILKRRLDKGLYSRLDHFQEDIFSIFARARRLSSTSSRVYRDSVTLQTAYIAARDKVCGSGRILKSQALKFSLADLEAELKEDAEAHVDEGEAMETGEDAPAEQNDDKNEKNGISASSGADSIQHNKINYSVGDFVYVVPAEPSLAKRIIHIQRLFRSNSSKTKGGSNVQMIQGFHYFRPEDTFHPANRKFYAKEVFKTEKHLTFPVTDVVGKCLVLFITDYPKLHVENIPADDVFVCESRYMARHRFFKKIKVVPFSIPESAVVSERETPLTMTKVDSVFKERIDRHREELAEVDEETRVQRVPLPNVARSSSSNSEAGEMEFEQYNLGSGAVVKLGDFVYVKVPPIVVPGSSSNTATLKAIRHVTRIWLSPQGVCSFLGSVYSTAQELYMSGVQLERLVAYKQEVYLTSVQDSLPLTDIIGRCSVLHVKEYAACRLTEVLEKDVYLCQNFYDETTRRISPLQSGIAKFTLSRQVLQDEVYYFSNTVNLQKAVLETVNLAQLPRRQPAPQPQLGAPGLMPLDDDLSNDLAGEDSLDSSAAPSRSSGSTPPPAPSLLHSGPASPALHTPAGKGSKKGRKQVSGYLLFSSEIRKSVTMRNPSANFGEISRLVGMEWKKLCEMERKAFEDRAHAVNQEAAERALHCSPGELLPGQVAGSLEMPLPNSPDIVYECMWGDCDVMFEDLADLYEHLLNEQTGHVYKMAATCTVSFECQWRSCSRQKKSSLLPFPLLTRLVRHTREVHIIKNTGRIVQHHDRTRNFIPSSRRPLINAAAAAAASAAAGATPPATASTLPGFTPGKAGFQVSVLGGAAASPTTGLAGLLQPQRQPQPIFAATPTKTQRLLHSEAYIKYIENLDKPYQSNWERHLSATADNTPVNDSLRLPTHWLPKDCQVPHPEVKQESKDVKKDALQALWALRELMMKDALYGVI